MTIIIYYSKILFLEFLYNIRDRGSGWCGWKWACLKPTF